MSALSEENIYVYIGFTGGLLLAFAQVPQIYRVHVRRSSEDISYTYQLFFAVGMVMFLIYYGYYERWAVFSTSVLSLCTILYMTGLKVYLEKIAPRSKRRKSSYGSDGGGGGGDGGSSDPQSYSLGSALLDADHLDERNARGGDGANAQ